MSGLTVESALVLLALGGAESWSEARERLLTADPDTGLLLQVCRERLQGLWPEGFAGGLGELSDVHMGVLEDVECTPFVELPVCAAAHSHWMLRVAAVNNPCLPDSVLAELARDSHRGVRRAVVVNAWGRLQGSDLLHLADDEDADVASMFRRVWGGPVG